MILPNCFIFVSLMDPMMIQVDETHLMSTARGVKHLQLVSNFRVSRCCQTCLFFCANDVHEEIRNVILDCPWCVQHHSFGDSACSVTAICVHKHDARSGNVRCTKFSRVWLVTLETCSWNSLNTWKVLLSLETLLKCVAISWNAWNAWDSWNSWNAWRTMIKHKTGFDPISKFDRRHALETLETCSWNTWKVLLSLETLLKCVAISWNDWNA